MAGRVGDEWMGRAMRGLCVLVLATLWAASAAAQTAPATDPAKALEGHLAKAKAAQSRGDMASVVTHLDQAIAVADAAGEAQKVAQVTLRLDRANALVSATRWPEAIAAADDALKRAEAIVGTSSGQLNSYLKVQMEAYSGAGKLTTALASAVRRKAITLATSGEGHKGEAYSDRCIEVAKLMTRLGKRAEAAAQWEAAEKAVEGTNRALTVRRMAWREAHVVGPYARVELGDKDMLVTEDGYIASDLVDLAGPVMGGLIPFKRTATSPVQWLDASLRAVFSSRYVPQDAFEFGSTTFYVGGKPVLRAPETGEVVGELPAELATCTRAAPDLFKCKAGAFSMNTFYDLEGKKLERFEAKVRMARGTASNPKAPLRIQQHVDGLVSGQFFGLWNAKRKKWVVDPSFKTIGPFDDAGRAYAQDAATERYGFIDMKGQWVVKPKWRKVTRHDGRFGAYQAHTAAGEGKDLWGLMDAKGAELATPTYTNADLLGPTRGCLWVRDAKAWGCVTAKGETQIPFEYSSFRGFSDEVAVVPVRVGDLPTPALVRYDGEVLMEAGVVYTKDRDLGLPVTKKQGWQTYALDGAGIKLERTGARAVAAFYDVWRESTTLEQAKVIIGLRNPELKPTLDSVTWTEKTLGGRKWLTARTVLPSPQRAFEVAITVEGTRPVLVFYLYQTGGGGGSKEKAWETFTPTLEGMRFEPAPWLRGDSK